MPLFALDALAHPIVQAPMAGGPSTPALVAAVSGAGGLGFLAAGYRPVDAVRADIDEVRSLLSEGIPFGVNVFAPPGHGSGAADVAAYAGTLAGEAARHNVQLGAPRWDDDRYCDKLDLLAAERVPVVSFTFGCPSPGDVDRLHRSDVAVWVTVTSPREAQTARSAGADVLVVQGIEAGGHRGGFDDGAPGDIGLLALLQLVRAAVGDDLPLVGAGGVANGSAVAAVLSAGAAAAGLGTAFMLCPEAATAPAHRQAIAGGAAPTAVTRAFTGRAARGIVNRFLREHSADAPSAYPEIHHLTAPVRAAARERGDADGFHLWAGQAYHLAQAVPAAELVELLAVQARAALRVASERIHRPASRSPGNGSLTRSGSRRRSQPGAKPGMQRRALLPVTTRCRTRCRRDPQLPDNDQVSARVRSQGGGRLAEVTTTPSTPSSTSVASAALSEHRSK